MQTKTDKSSAFYEFSDRSESLAGRLKVKISELGDVLSISPDMLAGYRTGRYPISAKAWRKLHNAEMEAGIRMPDHDSSKAELVRIRNELARHDPKFAQGVAKVKAARAAKTSSDGRHTSSLISTAPFHSAPAAPDRERIEEHVRQWLDRAEEVPGGLGYAWGQVRLHLRLDDLDKLSD